MATPTAAPLGFTPHFPLAEDQAKAWMVQALRGRVIGEVAGQVKCAEALARQEFWRE